MGSRCQQPVGWPLEGGYRGARGGGRRSSGVGLQLDQAGGVGEEKRGKIRN